MLAHFDMFRSLGRDRREVLFQEMKKISYMNITFSIEKLITRHLITQRASWSSQCFRGESCVCQKRNASWSGTLSDLFFNYCYLTEIRNFICSSWITNLFKTCRMSGLRKGMLLHVLLLYYPLLTLDSALKVNHFLSQGGNFFFICWFL